MTKSSTYVFCTFLCRFPCPTLSLYAHSQILVSSGAYVSRYIIQVAIHHYFRSASHFIKTPWVRSIPLPVFTHFMKVTSSLFNEIPLGKNEDDGYIFHSFLKESRLPQDLKSTKWEDVREILDKYKVCFPLCDIVWFVTWSSSFHSV